MKNSVKVGMLIGAVMAVFTVFAQTDGDEIAKLKARVTQLEKQVQLLSELVEPLKTQQASENRRRALREKFNDKMMRDRKKHTAEELNEAEELYQVANQKWGTAEANESLQKMVQKYPDINRTGCATLYLAQRSTGEERVRHLRECIEKYSDCFYGDGVQVGVYARYLLGAYYQVTNEHEKAQALYGEIKNKYADAVDHAGNLLVDIIKAEEK